MKHFSHAPWIVSILVSTSFSIQSFEYVKRYYNNWIVNNVLKQIVQDKTKQAECQQSDGQRIILAERTLAQNDYTNPLLVKALSRVPFYESWFSYAQTVYRVIDLVLSEIEKILRPIDRVLVTASTDVRENITYVLAPGALARKDSKDFEAQIKKNIVATRNILKNYAEKVKVLTIDQAVKDKLARMIAEGLESIDASAKIDTTTEPVEIKRLTWIERQYRNYQIQKFDNYVRQYCK